MTDDEKTVLVAMNVVNDAAISLIMVLRYDRSMIKQRTNLMVAKSQLSMALSHLDKIKID